MFCVVFVLMLQHDGAADGCRWQVLVKTEGAFCKPSGVLCVGS